MAGWPGNCDAGASSGKLEERRDEEARSASSPVQDPEASVAQKAVTFRSLKTEY